MAQGPLTERYLWPPRRRPTRSLRLLRSNPIRRKREARTLWLASRTKTPMNTKSTANCPRAASQSFLSQPSGFCMWLTLNHRLVPGTESVDGCVRLSLLKLTGISFPVKVLVRLAVAAKVQPCLLICRAVCEWYVVVGDLVEEVDLVLPQCDCGGDGMDRCVAPSLVEESAVLVQRGEVVHVLWGPQPVKTADLEVGPLRNISLIDS